MPLLEQVVLVVAAMMIGYFLLRRVF